MSDTHSKKLKLLQSASALILGASAMTANAQTVSTSGTAVTLASTDAKAVADQSNTAVTTSTVNNTDFKSVNGAVSSSSVSLDTSSATATAISNTAAPSLKDAAGATTATTAAIAVEQDNTKSATAEVGVGTGLGTEVTLTAGATTDSTLTVASSINRATATSNLATTSVSDTDFTANGTNTTLAARQDNTGPDLDGKITISATTANTAISLTAGATSGSDLSVSGNTDAASATGNSLTQRTTLDGAKLTLGTASASANTAPSAAAAADIDAAGAALMSSLQTNTFAAVLATNTGSAITLDAGATKGSTLDVTSNMQDAAATGSTATNAMTLSGTTVGTGAAIVSAQKSDADSGVTATTTGSVDITAASLSSTTGDTGSAVSLTDNKLQSRAIGGTVANTLSVVATTVTLKVPDIGAAAVISKSGLAADTSLSGTVSGAYATLNDQLIAGDVAATTNATAADLAGMTVQVTDDVENGSSISNERNSMTAQAQAAVATNSIAITVGGSLTDGDALTTSVANGAIVANIQEIADTSDVTATVNTTATPAILTKIGGILDASSVDTSSNKVQAFAEGATSTNSLSVSAQTLNVAAGVGGEPGTNLTVGTLAADTAFAVANRQDSGSGSITAELNDPVTVMTAIVGDTSGSSVTSTANMQDAFATSNKATNSVSLSATTLDGDAGVINAQNSDADVVALIGGTGAAPTAGGVGANAGVVIDFDGAVSSSAVAVTGNMVRGSAISNVGTNTLTVAATTLSGDGTEVRASADADGTATTADFSLGNSQTLDSAASSKTNVFATFGIDQAFDETLSNSNLAVSNNVQFGEALGNSATNSVTLLATGAGSTGIDPTAALNNVQSGLTAEISSKSEMTVFANAASSGSSVALNGNSNTALAVINNASNAMNISGLSVDGAAGSSAAVNIGSNFTAADYALNTSQDASGVLNSTAKTTAYNLDNADATTSGLQNGSVTMSKNATTAEGSANRVANNLSVSATDNGANAAIGNEQVSSADVTSVASSSSYKLELTTAASTVRAASGSTLAMEGNTTTALARGNSASNALTYTVGANYTGSTNDPTIADVTAATAGALVLNAQTNSGAVAANANSVTYAVALNGAAGSAGSALNSSANMANNAVTAIAFGNSASNSITMATFAAGIPSTAISNVQSNTGAVTATATSVAFTMTPTGPASGSALRSSGNTVNAQAIGNSSISTIGGGM